MKYKSSLQKAGLIIVSILLSLFIAEMVLRLVLPGDRNLRGLYVWQPNLHFLFHPDSTVFCGIRGAKNFTINSQGCRGDEFAEKNINLLCIGGSTTECLYLDDKETWFRLLCSNLNSVPGPWKFRIGSIGKSGCTTRENYIHLKYFAPQLGRLEGVIMMVGLNDLMWRLSRDSSYERNAEFSSVMQDSLARAIFYSPKNQEGRWGKSALNRFIHQLPFLKNRKVDWTIEDDRGEIYKKWRLNRRESAGLRDTLPDMTRALKEYEANLDLIYKETHNQGIKLILINQSAMYKDSMNSFESKLLWMGGIGNFQAESKHPYYTPRALRRGIDMYNQRLEQFCRSRNDIMFINLSSQISRDTTVFYDDCHFNESGARQVADILAREMGK